MPRQSLPAAWLVVAFASALPPTKSEIPPAAVEDGISVYFSPGGGCTV